MRLWLKTKSHLWLPLLNRSIEENGSATTRWQASSSYWADVSSNLRQMSDILQLRFRAHRCGSASRTNVLFHLCKFGARTDVLYHQGQHAGLKQPEERA